MGGPVDLTNNAFEFRPMPVGLEEELGDPNNMFPTDFGTFPDRGPADLVGNTFGFRPMPVGLEEELGNPLDPNNRQFGSNVITGRNFPSGLEQDEPEKKIPSRPGRNL